MNFGDRLMNLRKSKGMSQEDLATELDVTRQTVSKWESSQTVPDMNKLVEMANFFGISLDELVNSSDDVSSNNENENVYKESSVEKNNRKISSKIFVVGLAVALILCGIGLIKQNNAKKENESRAQQALEQSQKNIDAAQKRLEEIAVETASLNEQYNAKAQEAASLDMLDPDWYEKSTTLSKEKTAISRQISLLEQEQFLIKNADYSVYYPLVKPITYNIFYYIGGGVFAAAALIALIYFLVTRKKR